MLIGICGKSGSGKSTLARSIKELTTKEVVHLDIDKVGHEVLTFKEVKEELIKSFGSSVVENDMVNRKKLGEKVFASRKEMDKLSEITWKYMQIEIDKFIEENIDKVIILDWILLPNTKYFDKCDLKICLDIPYEIRKERAMKRDNITESDFALRDSASIDLSKYNFDYVISNQKENYERKLVKLL